MDLLYCVESHGISLKTLQNNVFEKGPCFLAIKDDGGNIFGAFSNVSLHHVQGKGYIGDGSCFLWKWNQVESKLQVFPATGSNHYMAISESNFIAFGGGYVTI